MKKKILSLLLVICLILPCSVLLTGCGKEKELTNAEASNVYKEVAVKTWSKIGVSNPTASVVSYSASSDDEIDVTISGTDSNSIQFKITANNMATILYLMGMLYEKTGFELNNGVVKFTATATVGGSSRSYNFTLKPKLDSKNNKVYLEAYIVVDESIQYVNIDADYDFDKGELKAFTVDYYTVGTPLPWIQVNLTKDGTATISMDMEGNKSFAQEITTKKDNFVNATKDIQKLDIELNATIQTYLNLTNTLAGLIQK